MKKLFLIIVLLSLSSISFSQENKEKYKDYKPCTECFDKWEKSGPVKDYNNLYPKQSENRGGQQVRRVVGGVVAIVVSAITLVIYSKTNKAVNEIH